MTHTFKRGDTGLTRDGRKFEVLADDMGGTHLLLVRAWGGGRWLAYEMRADGTSSSTGVDHDLMPPPPPVTDEETDAYWAAAYPTFGKVSEGVRRDVMRGLAAAFAVREARK